MPLLIIRIIITVAFYVFIVMCQCNGKILQIIVEFHLREVACLVSPQRRGTFSQCRGTLALPLPAPPPAGRGGWPSGMPHYPRRSLAACQVTLTHGQPE